MSLPEPYYSRDGITIYHTRCENIIPHVAPSSVDLLLTDPPYGFGQSEQGHRRRTASDPGHDSGFPMIHGDTEPFDPSPLLSYKRVVLFGANHYADKLPPVRSWLVWDKRNGATPDYNADAELLWTNIDGAIRTYHQCWRGFTRENDSLEPVAHVHPTQKPVNMMIWLLEKYTNPGDLVFDPYMGSGPIAKACQLLGRRYIGVEIEETYVMTARERLNQLVMQLAVTA